LGEQLVGSGPVAAGDTVRWIIGDTESGAGATKRVHILVKPTRPDPITNLGINTDRRTYLLEFRSTMVSDAILDVTIRGDIVLDPFCGSGTTILAAERTGRRGYVIELDPGHVDTAIARWERMAKRTAVHPNSKTFEEIRAERRREDGGT
jgi:Conjugal transfer protein/DNA methylase